MHACWFCAGPEHFAAVVAPVARAAAEAGRPVRIVAAAAYIGALRACGLIPDADGRFAAVVDDPGLTARRFRRLMASCPPGSLVVHVAVHLSGPDRPSPRGAGPLRRRLEGREAVLASLATSARARCLCVYDLASVCSWQADTVAERHHSHVAVAGRLVPVSEALRPPVETPPPALVD